MVVPICQSWPSRAAINYMQWCILCQKVPIELFSCKFLQLNLWHRKQTCLINLAILLTKSCTWIIFALKQLKQWMYSSLRLKITIILSWKEVNIILIIIEDVNHIEEAYDYNCYKYSNEILWYSYKNFLKLWPSWLLSLLIWIWPLFYLMLLS